MGQFGFVLPCLNLFVAPVAQLCDVLNKLSCVVARVRVVAFKALAFLHALVSPVGPGGSGQRGMAVIAEPGSECFLSERQEEKIEDCDAVFAK